MSIEVDIKNTADSLETLFDKAIVQRDSAQGEEKRRLRKATKKIDSALGLMEEAEDIIKGSTT